MYWFGWPAHSKALEYVRRLILYLYPRTLNMNPRQIIWAIAVLIWVNVLLYLSRLPRGIDWVSKYLPDEGFVVFGLIFSHALFSTPAIPLIKSLREIGKPDLPWVLALVAVTALTWIFHTDYDLSADAQAATGLVIFPLIAMGSAYVILMLGRKLPRMPSEMKKLPLDLE